MHSLAHRCLQVAALVNGAVHLLAGLSRQWCALDALHAALYSRLATRDKQGVTLATLRSEADVGLARLLDFSPSTSASACDYYLSRAAAHDAPADCGLLFAAAAVAHCDGTCGAAAARQMQLAALPYSSCPYDTAVVKLPNSLVRRLAVQVGSSRRGPGSGKAGCDCRAALCATLARGVPWPSALLCTTPSAAPIVLAAQEKTIAKQRCVIAQVCQRDGAKTVRSDTAGLGLIVQKFGIYISVQTLPTRKRYIIGCARQSGAALACLMVAAAKWVYSDDRWSLPDEAASTAITELEPREALIEAGKSCPGCRDALSGSVLARLGYEHPDTCNVLVYAVVEDMALKE